LPNKWKQRTRAHAALAGGIADVMMQGHPAVRMLLLLELNAAVLLLLLLMLLHAG